MKYSGETLNVLKHAKFCTMSKFNNYMGKNTLNLEKGLVQSVQDQTWVSERMQNGETQ